MLHHSPQLVRKIWSGSAGKSSRVKARRTLAAPGKKTKPAGVQPVRVSFFFAPLSIPFFFFFFFTPAGYGYRETVANLPSGTVLASGMSMVRRMPEPRPMPVLGMRPGETATTAHWPASWRRHQCAPSSCTNLVWLYVVCPSTTPEPAWRSRSSVPAGSQDFKI